MTNSPAFPLPIMLDWPRVEGLIDKAKLQWWWVAALLESGERRLGALFFLIRTPADTVEFKAVLTDLESGVTAERREEFAGTEVSFAPDRVDIAAPDIAMTGSRESGYTVKVRFADGSDYALTLQAAYPVMFGGACGAFSGWGSTSKQYGMGGLKVTGTARLADEPMAVTGEGWYDRQWSGETAPVVSPPGPLTWMGIWLESGDIVSLWDQIDTTHDPARKSWATIVRPDGTHIVTPMAPLAAGASGSFATRLGNPVPRGWTVRLPAADMTLQITQSELQEDTHRRFFSGALDVAATCGGRPVRGRGIAELVRWHG